MSELSPELLDEGERLILAAFRSARESGNPDWRHMTTAVLKNRLLTLTKRAFDERRWHVTTFSHFLALFPALVSVDANTHPPVARLLRETGDVVSLDGIKFTVMSPKQRIRPDLWRAVLDYSTEGGYVWDQDAGRAQAVASPEDDARPTLPSVDAETFAAWREEFAREQLDIVPPHMAEALTRWREHGLPSTQLPGALRGYWNAALKRHVLDRLESWFNENELPVPEDILTLQQREPTHTGDSEGLRELVIDCIRVMTRAELEQVKLPAAAVLRARRSAH